MVLVRCGAQISKIFGAVRSGARTAPHNVVLAPTGSGAWIPGTYDGLRIDVILSELAFCRGVSGHCRDNCGSVIPLDMSFGEFCFW